MRNKETGIKHNLGTSKVKLLHVVINKVHKLLRKPDENVVITKE